MHFRLITVFFVGLFLSPGFAQDNIWNCEQDASGEWRCLSTDQSDFNPPQPAEQVPLEISEQKNIVEILPPLEEERRQPVFFKPPEAVDAVSKRAGWNCAPNQEDETWNCSLIGNDPKGEFQIIQSDADEDDWITPSYNFAEEQIFRTLQNQLPADPWMTCVGQGARPVFDADKDLRETAPLDVHADYSEVFDKEITSFYGNVNMRRADQQIKAEMASYDSVSETMDAQGDVYYQEDELALYSDSIMLKLNSDEARLRNALFISPAGPVRGRASAVYRDSRTLSRYHDASFTSCRPGNQDWVIHAERLKMNKKTGQGSAKNAWLELKGVPVLYTPYISFPLDDRRVSGFLPPSFGSTEKNGFDLEIPFYWNIAPNFDATITPRYMTKRGGMIRGQLRYLTDISAGKLGLEVLPFDTIRDETRFSGSFQAKSDFGWGVTSNVDLNYVSDDDYFNELNNALGFSDTRHVRSLADFRFNRSWISLLARMEHYQTIDRSIASANLPYQKYPQIQLNLNHAFEELPLPISVALDTEYSYFFRSSRVSGHRVNIKPSVSFPYETPGFFVTPKFSVQHTEYMLEEQTAGQPDDISRTLPIMSLDSGLFFEKELGQSFVHTIEPRLFYLYIPHQDQDDIPLFDTSLYDFNINSLFRENRFNGLDRVQDANQLSLVLTSRLIDQENGRERLKLSVGEIFYFRDRKVGLSSGATDSDSFSNFIAELGGQLTDSFSFSTALQWNPDASEFTRGQAQLRYRDLPDRIFNLSYRYRRDDPDQPVNIEQTDASFRWPLFDNWYGVGRWQYSFNFNQTTESFLGLERESCCWRFRVVGRRFVNSISDSTEARAENGVFIQLEFKGLASFGDKVDEFLEKNLNGYRKPVN